MWPPHGGAAVDPALLPARAPARTRILPVVAPRTSDPHKAKPAGCRPPAAALGPPRAQPHLTLAPAPEVTPAGTASTCATITPGGGLFFACRRCDQDGYRPFDGANGLSFWIKPRGGVSANANATEVRPCASLAGAAAGQPAPPASRSAALRATKLPHQKLSPQNISLAPPQATQLPLKIFLRGENDNYCGAEPRLSDLTPSAAAGGWARFDVPIGAFSCYSLGDMTHLEFQNVNAAGAQGNDVDASFCLGDLQITR